MDFVNEEDDVGVFLDVIKDGLDPGLELAAEDSATNQAGDIEYEDLLVK